MKRMWHFKVYFFVTCFLFLNQTANASSQAVRCLLQGVVVDEPDSRAIYTKGKDLAVEKTVTKLTLNIKKIDGSVKKQCRNWLAGQAISVYLTDFFSIKKNQTITVSYFYKKNEADQHEHFELVSIP